MRVPDYYVRLVELPPTVLGATLPNDDGTFSVYINARLGDAARRETLCHELEHMARDHFYQSAPIAAQEAEARGETAPSAPPEHGAVRRYRDLASLTAYLQGLGALGNRAESLGAQPMRYKSGASENFAGSRFLIIIIAEEAPGNRSRRSPPRPPGACPH